MLLTVQIMTFKKYRLNLNKNINHTMLHNYEYDLQHV